MNHMARQHLKEASKSGSKEPYSAEWTDSESGEDGAGKEDAGKETAAPAYPASDDLYAQPPAAGGRKDGVASRAPLTDDVLGAPRDGPTNPKVTKPRTAHPSELGNEPATSLAQSSVMMSPGPTASQYPGTPGTVASHHSAHHAAEANCCLCFKPASTWLHRPGDPRAWIFHVCFHTCWFLLVVFAIAGMVAGESRPGRLSSTQSDVHDNDF
jgi:hypothetical protein